MSGLTDPDTIAAMLAGPATPIVRYDFDHRIGPNFTTDCRLHYTPNPDPAPALPVLRRGHFREAAKEARNAAVAHHASAQAQDVKEEKEGLAARPDPDFLFTHGRGSRLDAPAIVAFSEGFARTQCMLSFSDDRTHNERATTFRALQNQFPSITAIGGRSMGAQAAARAQLYGPAKKAVFFSYPLVRGVTIREEELLAIEADVDVLFIIGDEDPMAQELHFRAVRSRMRCRTWWMKVKRGDHSLFFDANFGRKRIGMCNVIGQIAAMWSARRDAQRTELTVDWEGSDEDGHPVWTDWNAAVPDPPLRATRFNVSVLGQPLPGGGFTFALQ